MDGRRVHRERLAVRVRLCVDTRRQQRAAADRLAGEARGRRRLPSEGDGRAAQQAPGHREAVPEREEVRRRQEGNRVCRQHRPRTENCRILLRKRHKGRCHRQQDACRRTEIKGGTVQEGRNRGAGQCRCVQRGLRLPRRGIRADGASDALAGEVPAAGGTRAAEDGGQGQLHPHRQRGPVPRVRAAHGGARLGCHVPRRHVRKGGLPKADGTRIHGGGGFRGRRFRRL